MDLDDLRPWQQQAGESSKAYHGFTHFLHLLPWERGMDRAYTQHQRVCRSRNPLKILHCSPDWQDWRFRYSWLERAEAHDREVAERDRQGRIHEIEQMNVRHIAVAIALQNLIAARLQKIAETGAVETMTLTQMAMLLDRVTLVERRARGATTEIVKHQSDEAERGAMLDLSRLSDGELDRFEDLVRKAQPHRAPDVREGTDDAATAR